MNTQPPVFRSVTPMIPTGGSLADALKFFTNHLGFRTTWQAGSGAGIQRSDISFMLVENSNRE